MKCVKDLLFLASANPQGNGLGKLKVYFASVKEGIHTFADHLLLFEKGNLGRGN